MRFARIAVHPGDTMRGLDEFVASADLDLLQLDFGRPRSEPLGPTGIPLFPSYAQGLEPTLRSLAKQLFLDPQLHVISDAGWCDTYACAEKAAAELVSLGNDKLVVSAVRGSNLLPILDMLAADGVDLNNRETGAQWRSLKAPLWAADLKMGAPPLVTALADGARVIVGGSYDGTSPLTAAAIAWLAWKWHDFDPLAMSAAASQACLAPRLGELNFGVAGDDKRGGIAWSSRFSTAVGDLQPDGAVALHRGQPFHADEASQLLSWLHGMGGPQLGQGRADVAVDFRTLRASVTDQGTLELQGAQGNKPSGAWDVEIRYQTGYSAEALAATNQSCSRTTEALQTWLYSRLGGLQHAQASLTIRCLRESSGAKAWYHFEFRSSDLASCQQFVADARVTISRSQGTLQWVVSPPEVMVECGVWATSIPGDAVDIAVDTRPADEWV